MTPEQLREWAEMAESAATYWKDRAERAEAALAECRARLEIDFATDGNGKRVPLPAGAPDGIACRDETIRLLEEKLSESGRKCERLKFHAGGMAYCCEALEMALTKAASIYANRVTLNIDDFLPLTKAYAAYRAEFKEEA